MIPLRPELVEFMSAESLGRFASTSKAQRVDVRETNAWRLLAGVQCPPRTARDTLERDAISRVQSQVDRRRLAADLSRSAPNTPRPEEPDHVTNRFTDFTYFLRIEEGDKLIWEGDLHAYPMCCTSDPSRPGDESIDLHLSGSLLARMRSWEGMVDYLAHEPTEDDYATQGDYDNSFPGQLQISIVAVREADSAMIALGCFEFDNPMGDADAARWMYFFRAKSPLCEFGWEEDFEPFHYKPSLALDLMHDSEGEGYLMRIRLYMGLYIPDLLDDLSRRDFQLLLTHLAGVPHRNRKAVRNALQHRAQSAMGLYDE